MPPPRPSLTPAIYYQDPKAALAWLEEAFGFELFMLIEDDQGRVAHAEMCFGSGVIMVGGEWSEDHRSPKAVGGRNTQTVHIQVREDIHLHFKRAEAAGAVIEQPPMEQFYGDLVYRCRDPEGHVWTVAQTVRRVTREEAEKTSGLKITGWI